jgi:hypothetical protein
MCEIEIQRDQRRHLSHRLAVAIRIPVGIALLVMTVLAVPDHSSVLETSVGFYSFTLGSALFSLLGSFAAQLAVYVALSRLLTGTRTVQWRRPGLCKSLWSWCSWEWSYYAEGWQSGYRVLGLEVVKSGRL